jgi:cation transport ATPase
MIKSGMNMPVDGVIISGLGIQVDESAMTGESDHLNKESFTRCLLR